jgi:hypothetical protein
MTREIQSDVEKFGIKSDSSTEIVVLLRLIVPAEDGRLYVKMDLLGDREIDFKPQSDLPHFCGPFITEDSSTAANSLGVR